MESNGAVAAVQESSKSTAYQKYRGILNTIQESLAVLSIVLILYAAIGAAIFQVIEGPFEHLHHDDGVTNSTNQTHEDYVGCSTGHKVTPMWTYGGSLYYCMTILLTVGYGNVTPRTDVGKIVTIIYASIGVPMTMLLLARLGEKIACDINICWALIWRYYYTKQCRKSVQQDQPSNTQSMTDITRSSGKTEDADTEVRSQSNQDVNYESTPNSNFKKNVRVVFGIEIDDQFNLPVSVPVVITIGHVLSGGILFSLHGHWSIVDVFYFSFVSAFTIGFGDCVPSSRVMTFGYIFAGLLLTSTSINTAVMRTKDRPKERQDPRSKV